MAGAREVWLHWRKWNTAFPVPPLSRPSLSSPSLKIPRLRLPPSRRLLHQMKPVQCKGRLWEREEAKGGKLCEAQQYQQWGERRVVLEALSSWQRQRVRERARGLCKYLYPIQCNEVVSQSLQNERQVSPVVRMKV